MFFVTSAQSKTENYIEGGKAIIQLISIFKSNKPPVAGFSVKSSIADSCAVKQQADLCFKNSSSRDLSVSLYRRIETAYESQPFTVKMLPKKQECLYELKAGIYKYRIEATKDTTTILLSEGEFKLQPCDNMKREIKE